MFVPSKINFYCQKKQEKTMKCSLNIVIFEFSLGWRIYNNTIGIRGRGKAFTWGHDERNFIKLSRNV